MPDVSHDTDAARTALCDYIWTLMEQFGDKIDIREHDEQIHRLAHALAAAARAEGAEALRLANIDAVNEAARANDAEAERDAALAMVRDAKEALWEIAGATRQKGESWERYAKRRGAMATKAAAATALTQPKEGTT